MFRHNIFLRNKALYDCIRDMTLTEAQKFKMTQSLITEGAAPIYFDHAGMTALYFIKSTDILEIFLDIHGELFEWQDWWAR